MSADYSQPHPVDGVMTAFPAGLGALLPPWDSIPSEFKSGRGKHVQFQRDWFYRGLTEAPNAKPGIDQRAALRHLATIQGSFEPKHEHKEAAVAWLASLWLEID